MIIEKNIFSVSEASHLLNCSNQKTYQLIKNGTLKGVYKDPLGRIWKIPDDSIIDYWFSQSRKYEQIISTSIQQNQVKIFTSTETIPSA